MKNITFINAGAGSGKTHRLTEILAEWVAKNKGNANKVMLTTFTKKAAQEIKERTQSKLLESSLFNEANQLQEAYVGTLHSVGYQFIKKYWYLIGISPELNEISENEQDVFFSQAIASVPTNEQLETLSELVEGFNMQSFDGEKSLFNPLKWKEDVIDIMNNALSNNIDLENSESLNISKNKIEEIFKTDKNINHYNKLFDDLIQFLQEKGALFSEPKEADLKDKIHKKIEDLERLRQRIGKNYTVKNIQELSSLIKGLKPISTAKKYKEEVIPFIPLLNAEEFDIFKLSAITYTEHIFDIAKQSLAEYKIFKQEKGLVDYTDMEVYFLKLLDIELVKNEIRESLKLVMVDEFQDSNPIQLSIFMKLSDIVDQSYWVGDPKQAIYGFRGTDPILIDAVIEEFTKPNSNNLKIEILKMSWRSAPSLVEFTNTVFGERMKGQVKDIELTNREQLKGDSEFEPFTNWKNTVKINPLSASESITLIPKRGIGDFKADETNLKFWFFNAQGDKDLKAFEGDKYNVKFSQKIKQLINRGILGELKVFDKDKKEERNLVGSDICILIRSNHNVDKFAAQLKKDGIEVNAAVSGLEKTLEFRILYNIVSLFIDKNSALSSTELAYLCGEEKNLHQLIEKRLSFVIPMLEEKNNDETFDFYGNLSEWLKDANHRQLIEAMKEQAMRLSVYQTIQLIVNQFNIFQKLLQFDNSNLRMSNVLKLKELAKDYESYCIRLNLGSSLSGFFNYIELSKEHKKQTSTTNENAVNIMTYHKAKGLEWPLVILMDLNDNPLYDNKFYRKEYFKTKVLNTATLEVNDPLKNRAVAFSFWPYGSAVTVNENLKTVIDNRIDGKFQKEIVSNEASRLMYVGITRARDYLYFTTNQVRNLSWLSNILPTWDFENSRNLKELNNVSFSKLDLFDIGHQLDFEGIKPDPDDEIPISEVEEVIKNKIYLKKHIPKPQGQNYYLNPSKVAPLQNITVTENSNFHHKRLAMKTSDSTELGNTLHQLLYIKDRTYFESQVSKSAALDELGVNKSEFIENTLLFNKYLNDNFKILKQYPEFAMEVEIGNQLAKGEADLVLEMEEGLILIDYKSYAGNDKVSNSSCEYYAGKYSGQLDLYAKMLETSFKNKKVIKKLIYYLVQGKIVELK